MNKPDKIILHHSATDEGTFESIKKYHVEQKKWRDIGYHYLITTDGYLHKGRDEKEVGAHTIGENEKSIGICLVGNFDKYEPNKNQLYTLYKLLKNISSRYGLLPIHGHNEFSTKTCPGTKFPMKEVLEKAYKDKIDEEISHWAKDSWEKAVKMGINDGIGAKNPVTEEQLMVFLDRLGLLD
ncbi:peptidoglycan recognition protein family protein [Maledivibacter halophilus]|uniref:N-acetylmuramoyl-L-alanine amidase n=1 Tax=Maledivibacter halophilus TaxID=36842 RepID=A0A1T5K679_9FIRM|nr:peptidoglycan recognition family protein [Maledivibacter halophilus]SKC59226.1 N-acetylmuramoyl-L-alanine amidase [Maledivibacter halophilus]